MIFRTAYKKVCSLLCHHTDESEAYFIQPPLIKTCKNVIRLVAVKAFEKTRVNILNQEFVSFKKNMFWLLVLMV